MDWNPIFAQLGSVLSVRSGSVCQYVQYLTRSDVRGKDSGPKHKTDKNERKLSFKVFIKKCEEVKGEDGRGMGQDVTLGTT